MRIPSSSSFILATLAISTSSPALAAPMPDTNADSGLASSNSGQQLASSGSQSNLPNGRRSSLSGDHRPLGAHKRMSYRRSQQIDTRQLGISSLGGLTHSVGDTLNRLLHARDEEEPLASSDAPSSSASQSISASATPSAVEAEGYSADVSSSVMNSSSAVPTQSASLVARDESAPSSARPTSVPASESSVASSAASSSVVSSEASQPSSTGAPLEARQLGLAPLLEPLMPVVNSLPEPVPQVVGTVIKLLAREPDSGARSTETTQPLFGRRFAQPRDEVPQPSSSVAEPPASTSCGHESVSAASFGDFGLGGTVQGVQNMVPGMQQFVGGLPNFIPGNLVPGNLIPGNILPGNLGGIPIAGGLLSPLVPNAPYNTPVGTPMTNPGQFMHGVVGQVGNVMPGGFPPATPPLFGYDAEAAEDQPVASQSPPASSAAASSSAPSDAVPTVA